MFSKYTTKLIIRALDQFAKCVKRLGLMNIEKRQLPDFSQRFRRNYLQLHSKYITRKRRQLKEIINRKYNQRIEIKKKTEFKRHLRTCIKGIFKISPFSK